MRTKISRRSFIRGLGLGAAALAAPGALTAQGAAKKPNVISVTTDDQGYGD